MSAPAASVSFVDLFFGELSGSFFRFIAPLTGTEFLLVVLGILVLSAAILSFGRFERRDAVNFLVAALAVALAYALLAAAASFFFDRVTWLATTVHPWLTAAWSRDLPFVLWLLALLGTGFVALVVAIALSAVLVALVLFALYVLYLVRLEVATVLFLPLIALVTLWDWFIDVMPYVVDRVGSWIAWVREGPEALRKVKRTLGDRTNESRGAEAAETLKQEAHRVYAKTRWWKPTFHTKVDTKRYHALAEHLEALARAARAAREFLEAEARLDRTKRD
jgi:hypothetical protein